MDADKKMQTFSNEQTSNKQKIFHQKKSNNFSFANDQSVDGIRDEVE